MEQLERSERHLMEKLEDNLFVSLSSCMPSSFGPDRNLQPRGFGFSHTHTFALLPSGSIITRTLHEHLAQNETYQAEGSKT